MKTKINQLILLLVLVLCSYASTAQKAGNNSHHSTNVAQMKTYVIEREIPGAGQLTPEQLKAISQTSCGVLKQMGPQIVWLHSYVTGDKIYCIYKAESEELVREHAKKGGFPANRVSQVSSVISPATAD
jgi:hypothetical protein